VSVLLGNGDGSFQFAPPERISPDDASRFIADVNRDGRPDLVTSDFSGSVEVRLGNGDGTFRPAQRVADGQQVLAVADVNREGRPDLITTQGVLLGTGDGTFQPLLPFPGGAAGTTRSVVADVNGDGLPDVLLDRPAASGGGLREVDVLLGRGDGTFRAAQSFPFRGRLVAVRVADFNGDGLPDLAMFTTLNGSTTFTAMLGNGDGTFRVTQAVTYAGGSSVVAVADLDGDGQPDLVVTVGDPEPAGTPSLSGVVVFPDNGDGTFGPPQLAAAGSGDLPGSLLVADVNRDGRPDLFFYEPFFGTRLLLGQGGGRFQDLGVIDDSAPSSVADVNGDGKLDLITFEGTRLGAGDGSFGPLLPFVDSSPLFVTVADVNGDGRLDLVTPEALLLGNGDGTFRTTNEAQGVPPHNVPQLIDLDGDGLPDTVALDHSGEILFRRGLAPGGTVFAPPVVLNDGFAPARDLVAFRTGAGWAIAAADASFDPALSSPQQPFVYPISVYRVGRDGKITRTVAFSTGLLPTRLAAADLTGSGRDDLIVTAALDDHVLISLQTAPATFAPPAVRDTGGAPSAIAVVDVTGDGRPDVVVTDQSSGDVTVLANDATGPGQADFAQQVRYRAGTGPSVVQASADGSGTLVVRATEQPAALVAGDFTGSGHNDLVVLQRAAPSLVVLAAVSGGLANPQPELSTPIEDGSGPVGRIGGLVAGDFDRDGRLDVAVLLPDRAEVWVYLGNGDGTFTFFSAAPAGDLPTGLSLAPGARPGVLDLLVGNEFGDVRRLAGDGRGYFRPPLPTTGGLPLAVRELGVGQQVALVADPLGDRVTLLARQAGSATFARVGALSAARSDLPFTPGTVLWARLNPADPFDDAVVLGAASNDVLVYRATGVGAGGVPTFAAPVRYPVGTSPAGVTAADVNGDGVLDLLVANQGSNDVSVLIGSIDPASGAWEARYGPRLESGGVGPIAVAVRDVTGDGIPDLVITNAGATAGTFTLLPGVGQGFFDDRSPRILGGTDRRPVAPPVPIPGTADQVLVTPTTVVRFDPDRPSAGAETVFVLPVDRPPLVGVAALPGGGLVALEEDGRVFLLDPVAGSSRFEEGLTLIALSGTPPDPTGLGVVSSEAGWEAVVSSEDGLYVFGLPRDVPLPPLPQGPVIHVTPLPDSPLALGVTLQDGLLHGGGPPQPSPFGASIPQDLAELFAGPPAPVTGTSNPQPEPLLTGSVAGRAGPGGTQAGGGDESLPSPPVLGQSAPAKGPSTELEEDFQRSTRRKLEGFVPRRLENEEDLDRPPDRPAPSAPEGREQAEAADEEVWSLGSAWLQAPRGPGREYVDQAEGAGHTPGSPASTTPPPERAAEAVREPSAALTGVGAPGTWLAALALLGMGGFRARGGVALGGWPPPNANPPVLRRLPRSLSR
jgi:hypothetical protein